MVHGHLKRRLSQVEEGDTYGQSTPGEAEAVGARLDAAADRQPAVLDRERMAAGRDLDLLTALAGALDPDEERAFVVTGLEVGDDEVETACAGVEVHGCIHL